MAYPRVGPGIQEAPMFKSEFSFNVKKFFFCTGAGMGGGIDPLPHQAFLNSPRQGLCERKVGPGQPQSWAGPKLFGAKCQFLITSQKMAFLHF